MITTLYRRENLLAWLVFWILLLGLARPAQASHLLGGEMTYRYLDAAGPAAAPLRYELTVSVYNNCSSAVLNDFATVGIYDRATGNKLALTTTNFATLNNGSLDIPQTSLAACTTPVVPPGCTILGNSQAYRLQKFVAVVNLPATTQGYFAFWTAYARNLDITNLFDPGNQYMSLYCTLAPPALANHSPVFSTKAVANLCANDTTYILNNAVDADGDQLVYSLGQPYGSDIPLSFAGLPALLGYNAGAGYSPTTPIGTASGNYSSINAATGTAKFRTTAGLNDKFAVAVDVREYRTINGQQVLIGITRRDVQLVVVACPLTVPPVLPTAAPVNPVPRTFTVEAGSTLTLPLPATQANGHPLTMTVSSVLLDGAGGYDATFAGNAGTLVAGSPAGVATLSSAASPVAGTFVYKPACTDVRAAPYDVTLLVQDDGCAGQTAGDVLRITVVKPAGPTNIAGNATVCGPNAVQSYTATGGTVPNVSWTATGGTIVGSSTANPVQVQWPAAGTYTLVAQGTTQYGCPTGQLTKTVVVNPPPALATAGSQAICQGSSTTLTVTGGTAPYTLTGGAAPVSSAGSFVLSPTQTTTYTLTDAGGACVATRQVTIAVNPKPEAKAGPAASICPGGAAQLGAAAVAGNTYSWSPATGLSNPAIANPTVALPNPTTGLLTQTYTLTETSPTGCVSTGTVAVTVQPLPIAAPGAAVAFCSGGTGQLGAAPVAGNTYSWRPATGLSNASLANPTVTLTNPTGAAITQTYTLTVTSTAGCLSTSTVAVTVNPLPTTNAGAAVAFCSGGTGQLGAAAVAGNIYSWSPTAGLSNAASANPTVTLTNSTSAPVTQTYTLTVTNAATGCANTATVTVTVQPLPVAAAGAAVAICSGGTGQLGAAPLAGFTYSWSPAIGLSSTTVANPTVTLINTTGMVSNQTYTLTVTNAATGCTNTSTVAVAVQPLPAAGAGPALTICSGGTGQLGAAAVAGNTYSWSPTAGLSNAASANPTVTLTNPTGAAITQTYTLTATSAAGCVSTSTVAVTVNPLPTANAGAAVAFCSGGTGQLGAAAVAGNTYSWSPTAGLSNAASANPTVTLTNPTSAPVTQTYTLTVTNAATGCVSTGTVAVTVQPLPVATAGAAVAICSGGTGQLGAAPVAGLIYSWSPATGLSNPAIANPTVTLPNPTAGPLTQTYTLTVTNANACVVTSTAVVTVHPLPVAAAGAAVAICSGGTGQLGSAPVAGLTYNWSPAMGLSNATSANPTVTLTNPTGATTSQTYTLTATSAAGCVSTSTVAVAVSPAVVPGAIGTGQTVCAGSVPAPLTSAAPAGGGTGSYAYQWETSPDNSTWQPILNATGLSYAPGPLAATTHFRRRVVAGACGVAYTSAITIQVQPLLVPAVALPAPPAQCAGTVFTFTPVPTNAGATPVYQWFVNGAPVGIGPAYTSSTLADGDQVQVVMTPTAGFCASGTAAATAGVRLTPTPAPTLTIVLQTALPVCAGTPIRFSLGQATALGTSPQYQWQVDGLDVAGATGPTFTSTTLRNGQAVALVLRTTTACGQPATATSGAVRVALSPTVHLSAGPNKTIMQGEAVELEGTADGSYPVVWTSAATLAMGNNPLRPLASPTATTTYTLSAGAGYCAAPSTVTVTVLRRVRIPNAFTPNADHNDDTWQIEGIEDYPGSHVLVFNRWGGKIFEASGYGRATEWNGTIKGEPAPIGTYYYVVTLGNGRSYTGPLTIMY